MISDGFDLIVYGANRYGYLWNYIFNDCESYYLN